MTVAPDSPDRLRSLRDRFALTSPCSNCPFLKQDGVRLDTTRRVREIAGYAVGPGAGAAFHCHKTTGEEGPGPLDLRECAGLLVFAKKYGFPTQLLQIALRVGLFDPEKLRGEERVFDSVEEMVKVNVAFWRKVRSRR